MQLQQQQQQQQKRMNDGAGDSATEMQLDKTKLIVNYVPQFATEDDLATIFNQIGELESIRIMRDYKTGYSFGFGFVKYVKEDDAAKAIEMLNGYNFRFVDVKQKRRGVVDVQIFAEINVWKCHIQGRLDRTWKTQICI